MKRSVAVSSFSGILLLFLALCQPAAAAPAAARGPIKIGALLPLTGALLHEGPQVKRGIELALEHYGNVVAGRKIELLVEDDGTDPTAALDKARKLVERDGVSIVIAPQASNVANAVQPYLTEKKIISLKSRQFPLPLTRKFPYLFVAEGTHRQTTAPMGDYAYNVLKYKTVSTMMADFIAGKDIMGGFTERFKELGGTVVQEQPFPVQTMDFSSYLTNVKPADALAAWTGGPGGANLAKQHVEYGINKKMPLITPFLSGILNEDVIPSIGDIVLGITGTSSYSSTIDNPLNKKVVADYRKKYNQKPGDSGIIGGYVNTQVIIEALKATGGDTDPEKLKAAILKLNIQTPAGPLRFSPDRLGIVNIYISKIAKVDGEYAWQVVQTYRDVQPR